MKDYKNKNFYFLCSLPRSGNTIFSSLMNQNKNVKVSSYSILPKISESIISCKDHLNFKNFPDHSSFNNILDNLFNNYYESWNVKNIIDRGPWGYRGFKGKRNYYSFITTLFNKRKFIILYRPILEVLVSLIKMDKPKNVIDYCNEAMSESFLSDGYYSIKTLITEKENFKVIQYDNFILNPVETIEEVCKYLNIPFQKPDLNKIRQFNINGVEYDDSVLVNKYHHIRTNEIKKEKIEIEKWLPKEIIDKYSSWEIKF